MKNNNYLKLIIVSTILLLGLTAMSVLNSAQQPNIVGTWISDDDSLWKVVYTNDGLRQDYYEGELIASYNYQVAQSCGEEVSTDGYFIKSEELDGLDFSCDLINNVHTDSGSGEITLSITSEGGKLFLFTKE